VHSNLLMLIMQKGCSKCHFLFKFLYLLYSIVIILRSYADNAYNHVYNIDISVTVVAQ